MGLEFAINVSIGRKAMHVNDVDRGAMVMPHPLKRDADRVNVTDMEMKRWEFVTFKLVNAFANTTLRELIVPNAVKITTGIQ